MEEVSGNFCRLGAVPQFIANKKVMCQMRPLSRAGLRLRNKRGRKPGKPS